MDNCGHTRLLAVHHWRLSKGGQAGGRPIKKTINHSLTAQKFLLTYCHIIKTRNIFHELFYQLCIADVFKTPSQVWKEATMTKIKLFFFHDLSTQFQSFFELVKIIQRHLRSSWEKKLSKVLLSEDFFAFHHILFSMFRCFKILRTILTFYILGLMGKSNKEKFHYFKTFLITFFGFHSA